MNIKKISPWKFILGTLVVLSIPSVFVFSLERYTTSNEHYCMTCHYKMWGKDFLTHSNLHPDSVRCPQCHANHDEIIPKDFSAHPERINPNCVRCHKKMFKKTDTEGFRNNVMKINIPHKFHLQEVGALCTDCHFNIKHDKFRPVTNRPRMETCLECHDKETTPCSKCHARGAEEVLAALPRTDTIQRKACEKCHAGFASIPLSFYGLEFPHQTHLNQGLDCGACHSNRTLHGQIVKSREDCMGCHHQDTERECTGCHGFEKRFRRGLALSALTGKPDPMADVVTCDVCHAGIAEGHSREAVLETCATCHEEPGFKNKVGEIQADTEASIQKVEELLGKARNVAPDLPEAGRQQVQPLIDRAEKILKTLKRDRSRGFHNAGYARLLVKDAEEGLKKAVSVKEAQVQPESKQE